MGGFQNALRLIGKPWEVLEWSGVQVPCNEKVICIGVGILTKF